ncbi:MAG: hypothetical protein VKJ46_08070, partial [Leptolyngbyaceae bacterium]|nr:hypothetical protein [Leptolyngbyaceae bacterium]
VQIHLYGSLPYLYQQGDRPGGTNLPPYLKLKTAVAWTTISRNVPDRGAVRSQTLLRPLSCRHTEGGRPPIRRLGTIWKASDGSSLLGTVKVVYNSP